MTLEEEERKGLWHDVQVTCDADTMTVFQTNLPKVVKRRYAKIVVNKAGLVRRA